jgi:phage repressor protein C with HTH and peptisase S24 domain
MAAVSMSDERMIDMDGFGARLREAIAPEKPTAFAARAGVAEPTLFKYLKPPMNFSPSVEIMARIAQAAGSSIDYLVTGRGEPPQPDAEVIKIPRYDVQLAAGAGSWNEGRKLIEEMPFTRAFIQRKLGRPSTLGLSVVEGRGDSMFPTIHDGALVIVDENERSLIDGVFAFLLDTEARLKRFRRLTSGLMIISDNPAYPPETVEGEDLKRVQLIGRVKWVGQLL